MKRFFLPIFATVLVTPVCLAEGIFKCTAGTEVTYQSEPCTEGISRVVLSIPTTKLDASVNDGVSTATAKQSGLLSSEDELQPGMSDLQVLNHRHWGKPQRITRNREARAWHEYWNYERGPVSGTRLHFVNAKLIAIANIEPPAQTATTMSVVMEANRQQ